MELLSLTVTSGASGLGTASLYFFCAGLCMLVVMTLAYLWYTIGTVRLSKAVAQETSASPAAGSKTTGKRAASTVRAASAGATGVATLAPTVAAEMTGAVPATGETATAASDLVLHEQPDGETPIALLVSQIFRTIVEQHAPWSNLYEFSISFTVALLLCYLIFEARFHERVRAWGLYVCLLALITVGIALVIGSTYNLIGNSTALIPALQDQPILTVHVSMAIFAYALFSVAFGRS